MNSVGVLPTAYLNATPAHISKSLFLNAKQILKQFVLMEGHKRNTEVWFQPFYSLKNYAATLYEIEALITNSKFLEAQRQTSEFIKVVLAGIEYYHTYAIFSKNNTQV